jgi:uncharacterized protein YqjF (DUF2071 family)
VRPGARLDRDPPRSEVLAQASSLEETEHRPWPVRAEPWVMGQSWRDLLFAHWRVPVETLRPHVPARLVLEEFDGSAWIGVTPFTVSGLRLRGLPPLPFLSRFEELNCRTYVRVGDRPGIWFFTLDASSRLMVEAARRTYRLPYRYARMRRTPRFESRRGRDVSVDAAWQPRGPAFAAEPGSLEYFLTERYCLYADEGRARADIHHRPWPLQAAEAELDLRNFAPVPLEGEPLLHHAARQDVVVWPLERLE